MTKASILLIEDDEDIAYTLSTALKLEGYSVTAASTLAQGRLMAERHSPDLVLLDIMLPDGNGLAYCEELRGKSQVPILFLSALSTKEDTLAGLRAGGDDYITKPYDLELLLARVEALLRRSRPMAAPQPPMKAGRVELNPASHRAYLWDRDLLLKPKEFALLEMLVKHQGQTLETSELYQQVWGMAPSGDLRTVKEHVSRIRKKLGQHSGLTIETLRGRGYRLVVADPLPHSPHPHR